MNPPRESSWSIFLQSVAGASRSALILVSCLWLLISPTAQAIVDSNANGMSDLWEKHFNSNQLFAPSFLPLDDADGDGVSNLDESLAGTDPEDGTPPDGFLQAQVIHSPAVYINGANGPEVFTPEAFSISWATVRGKRYTLLCSPDLSAGSWIPIGDPVLGYGWDLETAVAPTQTGDGLPDKLFWRVAVDDIDTDGDGFTNYEEYRKRTDPYIADHDDDGLPDTWEVFHGLSSNDNGQTDPDNGPNGDPDEDDLKNLYEYWFRGDPNNPDTDADDLSDYEEIYITYTALDNPDTDADGLTDWEEVNLYDTNPRNSDSDDDGLSDGQEVLTHLTDPLKQDTDVDGMLDGWEISYQLNPLSNADASIDSDGDLLSNATEALLKLNPRLTDTDVDSTPDGDEDTDGDLLSNLSEVVTHLTNPSRFDTDGDRMPDGFEETSPHLNPLVHDDSDIDFDLDGMSDLYEAVYGFNPDLNDSGTDLDGDGLTTAQEVVFGSDPTDDDIDRDELTDKQEKENLLLPTDPWNWDTDGDRLPDKWELDYGLDPTTFNDESADDDQDNLSLYLEYRNGTDPRLNDTDGDGSFDGVEVAANTSPTDPDWGGTPPAPPASASRMMAMNSIQAPTQPETYQAAFDVRTAGKKPTRSCAVCHQLEVEVDGKLYGPNEPVTLLKSKAYDIRVKNTPVNLVPGNPEPPHIDNAKFTIWPVPVGNQTIVKSPADSEEPDVFIASEGDILHYIIANDEKLLVQDKDWPADKAQEPTKKKATITSPVFKLKNNADVTKGWDSTETPHWTSVGVGKANSILRLRFPGATVGELGSKFEIVPHPDDAGKLTITDAAIAQENTDFKINGTAATTIDGCRILLRAKVAPNPTAGMLRAHVFDAVTLSTGVYHIWDSRNANTALDPRKNTAAYRDALNQAFRDQCNVTFDVTSSDEIDMRYGDAPSPLPGEPPPPELPRLFDATTGGFPWNTARPAVYNEAIGASGVKIPIFIVNNLDVAADPTMVGIVGGDRKEVYVESSLDAIAAVHEVGHLLFLSTRAEGQANSHDLGNGPPELNGYPLMYQSYDNLTSWLRRKDWFKANEKAKSR